MVAASPESCAPSPLHTAENNAIQHQPNGGHTVVLGAARVPIESEEDAGEGRKVLAG